MYKKTDLTNTSDSDFTLVEKRKSDVIKKASVKSDALKNSFAHSFVVHSFLHSFLHSFIHAFIHSFIHVNATINITLAVSTQANKFTSSARGSLSAVRPNNKRSLGACITVHSLANTPRELPQATGRPLVSRADGYCTTALRSRRTIVSSPTDRPRPPRSPTSRAVSRGASVCPQGGDCVITH